MVTLVITIMIVRTKCANLYRPLCLYVYIHIYVAMIAKDHSGNYTFTYKESDIQSMSTSI